MRGIKPNISMKSKLLILFALYFFRYAEGESLMMRSREADMRVQFEIEEGQPPGTFVGTIPTKPNFTYRFNERPPEFLLNGTTGVITTAMEIDREMLASERFDLVILSSQPTYPLEVRIVILDINDNSPFFPEPSIEVSFSESANIATRVILDTANDRDVGINDVTTDYKIISGNSKFRLVVTTNPSGETPYLHLETTAKLDRETESYYKLNISAEDGGTPPRYGFLTVHVSILDVNDNPPIFDHSDYSVSLNESVPPGTSVLQVRATDNDMGDNSKITYFLSDSENQFSVDPQTGVISTLDTLKCEHNCQIQGKCPKSCVFTVFARDHGSPRQDGRAYVTVNLLDANDHDPSIRFRFFPSTASYATVDENAENGSVVAAVSVIDLDEGPNGETSVAQIEGGNELGHFRLESTPSFDIVRVNGVLDREQISKYNLTITATDRGIPPRSSTAFLIIHVNDVNDHDPIFEKNEYSAVLSETVMKGTFVAGILATDLDTGINSDIYYSFVSGNERRWFEIDVYTGLVTTSEYLNREDQDYVELKISARDGGPNPRFAYTILRIQILDENDEAPSFAEDVMNVTLSESAPPNSLVAVVTAVDNDLGTNGSVEYLLHSDVDSSKFSLDSTYGRLTLKEQLDRETQNIWSLVIVAKDGGTPSLSSTVTLNIILLDEDDNKPYFYPKQYFRTIRSSDSPGTVVARLTATDPDLGKNAKLKFTLLNGDGNFEIEEDSGVVKTKTRLSKRDVSKYEIKVSVKNPTNIEDDIFDEAVIFVYVGDAEHRPIQFDLSKGYNFVIEENMKTSEFVESREIGRLSVRSMRAGVKYAIVDGNSDDSFLVEESLGIIHTARPIDREVHSRFSLDVVAHDFVGFTHTTVNITVSDVNDCFPVFESPTRPVEVPEDCSVGHEIYLVKAYDLDTGSNGMIEYSLSTQHDTFYIDKTSGMIYLKRTVRSEVGNEYKVVVTARDLGTPSLSSKLELTILIKDVNDRTPVFDHMSYETSLLESVPVNDRFYLLKATDADYGINKQITYSITDGNEENQFGIFPDGYLYVKRLLDREKRDFYSLRVIAKDNGKEPRSSSVNIVIHIIDENDNPPMFDNKTYTFFITENEPPETYVGRLSAEDFDKGVNAELTYSITNTQTDFIINPKTGFIRTLRHFDREQLVEASGHDYLVMDAVVLDGGSTPLKDEAKVVVYITDVNDNVPQFIRTPYVASISESSPAGTQVMRIVAIDVDYGINGNIQYSIIHGNDGNVFQIDDITGEITVAKPTLDRETSPNYTLTVMARDMGEEISFNTTSVVRIDILDENDNVPRFCNETTRYINISEDATVGSKIFEFSASDNDLGVNSEITFLIASGNFKETFRIDALTGYLYLARPLDFEDKSSYILNVSATDGGTPRLATTMQIVVQVLDINDNAPRFSSTAVVRKIDENIPLNTPVVTISAYDRDSGMNGKILFNISHQEPPGNHFAIQSETGLIFTNALVDREFSDTFRLTVVATDQAADVAMRLSVEKIVTIIVEDLNDNAPTFVSMDAGILPGGMDKGYKIMTLSANDPDANNNGMVKYELEGGDSTLFTLDKKSGDLFTAVAIEKPAVSYTLTVKAMDEAFISKSSRNKVTIIGTIDKSDGPIFSSSVYTGSVLENKPVGTSVLSVQARTQDSNNKTQVEYFLTSITNDSGLPESRIFAINRFSGVISTAAVLDREGGAKQFHLDVYAVDTSSKIVKTSKAIVSITILDINDSPPVFIDNPYRVSLSENAIAGHQVVTVSATDPDSEGSLTYVLIDEESDDTFRLDPSTGDLYLNQPLDREIEDLHKVKIKADDGNQSAETTVIIEVSFFLFIYFIYCFDIFQVNFNKYLRDYKCSSQPWTDPQY